MQLISVPGGYSLAPSDGPTTFKMSCFCKQYEPIPSKCASVNTPSLQILKLINISGVNDFLVFSSQFYAAP
jgi:hypothetical protein